jgi:hypothetical protein
VRNYLSDLSPVFFILILIAFVSAVGTCAQRLGT